MVVRRWRPTTLCVQDEVIRKRTTTTGGRFHERAREGGRLRQVAAVIYCSTPSRQCRGCVLVHHHGVYACWCITLDGESGHPTLPPNWMRCWS